MTITDHDKLALVDYLKKRLDFLKNCKAYVEKRLSDDERQFINTCDDEDICRKYFCHIDYALRNTFRYCMLIAYCSFLEESVKLLCERSVADYSAKLNAIRRGTWLSKHRQLLRRHTALDLAAMAEDLDTMEDFVAVRNCIVHAWGNLDKCRNKARLREIVEKRRDLLATTEDGFLVVERDAVSTASVTSRKLVNKLLKDLLGPPPKSI